MALLIKKEINFGILFFLLLFFLNIGIKEAFRLFEGYDIILEGTVFLIFISLIIIIFTAKTAYRSILHRGLILFFILFFLSFAGSNPDYGLQKSYLGLMVPLTLGCIFARKRWTEEQIINYIILAVLIISLIGIAFKLRGGFFNRSVSFGLLGSIPFGWTNGMAFLAIVLQRDKKIKKILLALFFFLMVLWTGSKGPLVGIFIVCLIFINRVIGNKFSTKLWILTIVGIGGMVLSSYSDDIRSVRMIVDFLEDPEEYSEGVGKGSIGTREEYASISIDMFLENPILGVGFGGWRSNFLIGHKYPHNVFFELLAEVGILGLFFFFFFLKKLKFNSIVSYIGLYGLITLLFSGDFSYLRYALFPLLMIYFVQINNKQIQIN